MPILISIDAVIKPVSKAVNISDVGDRLFQESLTRSQLERSRIFSLHANPRLALRTIAFERKTRQQ